MKRIAIFGCRDAEHLIEQIEKDQKRTYEIVCLCDNDTKYTDTIISGVSVINSESIYSFYRNGKVEKVIIAVRKGYSRYCIIRQLLELGINQEDLILLKPSLLTYRLPIKFDRGDEGYNRQWLDMSDSHKPIIHHLEINYADGCNLNCRGCLHFSNLYERNEFPDDDELLNSISEIASHCEIFQFRVLGGEPLLNPNLESFLIKLRGILPNTDLAVISNGILIPKMPESLFRIMKENEIGFNLTLYPPTLKMKERIYETLDSSGVSYGSHEARTDKFEKFIKSVPSVVDNRPYEVCEPRGILVVKGKELYRCPVEAYIEKFYEKFSIKKRPPRGIDVFEFNGEWGQLVDDLYLKPRQFCKYCSDKSVFYEWSNGKPEKEDWLV